MDVSGQLHAQAAILSGKEMSVSTRWAPVSVRTQWRREKVLTSAKNRTLVVQLVA
jgi:hypothetical protein